MGSGKGAFRPVRYTVWVKQSWEIVDAFFLSSSCDVRYSTAVCKMWLSVTKMMVWMLFERVLCSGRTEVQSVQYGKEKGIKNRVFAR